MATSWYQLKSILWKNWLQKKAHFSGFLAEILLPVAFMALLIAIKSITNVYDSPDVAYYCGQTYPWFYSGAFDQAQPNSLEIFQCNMKPDTCSANHYYENSYSTNINGQSVSFYDQYGYIESPESSGISIYPYYAFTIADKSTIFGHDTQVEFENPSLPYCSVLKKISRNHAILAVAPSDSSLSTAATNLQSYLSLQCDGRYNQSVVYFQSEGKINSYVTNKDYDDANYGQGKVAFAIILNQADIATAQWDYAIRVNYTGIFDQDDPTVACLYGGTGCAFRYTIPTTKYYSNDLMKPQTSDYMFGYSYSGFLTLQQTMDQYIFSFYNGVETEIMASVGLMPTQDYQSDDFQYIIASTLGIFYMLSFLYPVSRLIRALVLEKECRIKEGMKMMGLTSTIYNLSWLITTVLQMTLISVLITLVSSTTVFEYSNKFYVFIYFEAFSLAVINMCFLMAAFFSRSKTASLLGPMIFFATFFPYYSVSDPQYDQSSKAAACLLAPTCFALGANVFADYEGGLVGIQSDNVSQETSNFTYSLCVGMLFFDAFLYGILAWYCDKVIPSEFGTSLPFYFPLLPSYWCGASSSNKYGGVLFGWIYELFGWGGYRKVSTGRELQQPGNELDSGLLDDVESVDPKKAKYFEPVSPDLKQQIQEEKCISIRKLRKVFKNPAGGDDRIAVAGLNLEMYQNQVTVMLGHNGAGKTTTISMLVGMIPPTSGNAMMPGGLDISNDMTQVRRNLGVCPQHDILFPELTALQHLEIFAAFKGVAPAEVANEAKKMLAEVGLKEKANAKSSTLSGGQKRKLSLGIALIGDSKVVILDEPTSGMDPFSRRSTWNIIQRNKRGRVILLTTHFLDEADKLGDRVAIMAQGKLMCCGSPLFLKNRFGVGYTLTIVKEAHMKTGSDALAAISNKISDLVNSFIPEAEPLSDVGAEQSLRLPFSASDRFVELFEAFDRNKNELGIAEYGISVTTLEEVFLKVADMEEDEEDEESDAKSGISGEHGALSGQNVHKLAGNLKANKADDTLDISPKQGLLNSDYINVEQQNPFWQHFKALLIKRAIYAKRDTRMIICQLVLPVILIVVGLSLLLMKPNLNQPDYVLSPTDLNTEFATSKRNFVPFLIAGDNCDTCEQMQTRFNGNQNNGVYGVAVPITVPSVDAFHGCAVGAAPLYNMSQYLINPPKSDLSMESGSTIYGTVTLADQTNSTFLNYNVLVNGSSLHGAGMYVNQVHQSFLQVMSGISTAKIVAHNYPLPQTYKQENQSAAIDAFVVSLFAMIAMCFIPASFAVFVVKEREVKAKHQQVISGVSIYAYWISTYLWDVVSYLPTALLIIAIMYAYGIDAYTEGPAASAIVVLVLLYGPATAAITYMISFLFVSHSTAQVAVMFFNFITGLCLMVVSFVLTTIPSTAEDNLKLRYLFRLFPSFCIGDGIAQLALCTQGRDCPSIDRNGYNFENFQSPFSWDTAGGDIVFLAVESVVYFLIAVLIEYSLTFPSLMAWLYRIEDPGITPSELAEDDVDVANERRRVTTGGANHDIVKIDGLRKLYPANSRAGGVSINGLCFPPTKNNVKVAVQSLSFGIPRGECFGFLGINGAGKTTTLSILSGEFPPTAGNAFVDGFSIAVDQSKIRRKIGYCPQFDALLELLTVREHLELYGRIKGFQGALLEDIVAKKLDQLDLKDFENKTAGSLSGGNKRKLSVAVATVGDPPIVFLDEPSTGMDPKARRFMWKVIARMSTQDARCSVILTTHSMEEAEALCTRIGIMVNGKLRCLGSSQHLKHRFGNGFEVNIKILSPSEESMLGLLKIIRERTTIGSLAPTVSNPVHHPTGRKISSEESAGEWLDRVRITQSNVREIGAVLGNIPRTQEINPFGSGGLIYDSIQGEGSVTARLFLDWWLSEDYFLTLQSFMDQEFGERAQLLERSSAQSVRYRIRKITAVMEGEETSSSSSRKSNQIVDETASGVNPLSEIFAKIEAKKSSLHVQEYSVGQTTLEQIFNQFASQQDNPEVAMAMANGDTSFRSSLENNRTRSSFVRVD